MNSIAAQRRPVRPPECETHRAGGSCHGRLPGNSPLGKTRQAGMLSYCPLSPQPGIWLSQGKRILIESDLQAPVIPAQAGIQTPVFSRYRRECAIIFNCTGRRELAGHNVDAGWFDFVSTELPHQVLFAEAGRGLDSRLRGNDGLQSLRNLECVCPDGYPAHAEGIEWAVTHRTHVGGGTPGTLGLLYSRKWSRIFARRDPALSGLQEGP